MSSGKTHPNSSLSLSTAGRQVSNYFGHVKPVCDKDVIRFGFAGSAVLGVYGGSQAHRQGVFTQLLDKAVKHIEANGVSETLVIELCERDVSRGSDYTVGIAASTQKNSLGFVHNAVRQWSNGSCISNSSAASAPSTWAQVSLRVPLPVNGTLGSNSTRFSNSTMGSNSTHSSNSTIHRMSKREDACNLASKCGISGDDFMKFNSNPDLCASLKPGQPVCCSAGPLPDLKPKPNADGSCAVYTTKAEDTCADIAARNMLVTQDLEDLNKNTWGWNGCDMLWVGVNMCLSSGDPPMPAPVANAVCGPQVVGTEKPTDGTDIALLNPCPLNVCCNVWGQCGMSDDFCIQKNSSSGAPGTSGLQNGCISSCGTDIIKGDPVEKPIRIAYFEAWNSARACLRMHASQIDTSYYTHIHWAFANLTEDFKPDVSGLQEEFDIFKGLAGVKKIISFGGWAFSTEAGTYAIFKNAVKEANRETFKNNVLEFVNSTGLDGADFDWEYPAAPDIDGVPPGDPAEGADYAKFLALMKSSMPEGKTVSFAAPASYWYLKQFPIDTIAKTVDYIVYMTYDLHGQWDYGNQWATPGCDTGNCLRSHVNGTETLLSLAMITKAGVNTNKVVVGVSSYGRSFRMAEKDCTGPDCKFTGSRAQSDAAKGECTDTAGYISNAEIDNIISKGGNIKTWSENETDYLVYNDYEWVAYMSDITKSARTVLYSLYNFAGTTDWAVDLQSFESDVHYDNPGDVDEPPPPTCDGTYSNLEDIEKDKDKIPVECMAAYLLDALAALLDKGIKDYDDILKTDYDEKFGYFADAITQKWKKDLNDFYQDHTDEYFDCVQAVNTDEPHVYRNESVACPPKHVDGHAYNLYLVPKDTNKLAEFLNKEYSIDIEWTYGTSIEIAPCIKNDCDEWGNMIGSLGLKPDFKVPNPKDSVGQSIENIRSLPNYFRGEAGWIKVMAFEEEPQDAVDGAAVPVFMIQQAVQSMHDIYKAGEDIEKEKMKNLIIMCITAFLFILPGLGEAMAAISGIAMIARIATMVAEVGGLATGAYDLATNEDNLALGIFSLLLGFVGLKGALKGTWKDAAALRRKMTPADIDGMGDFVKNGLNKIGGLNNKVCKL
ncbi:glycoside hydrolase family 18 protein [Aulographum hederae CBS 113979]|uniref:chitinase n=1 Tax=Aulographum hederae CBS 113979 TaxID=1176131 RepID=A0A6G1H6G5_9PEZI|nr:glycoside hydrolase family 18 protein [Aulographum hederae CBS 113979]